MKKIYFIILLLFVSCFLCGCGNGNGNSNRFLVVENWTEASIGVSRDYKIIVDKETKIMYLNHRTGITTMLNYDGTPMVYEGDLN